jgi:hypothetical protein
VESYAVGHMDECSITVVIQTESYPALTALPITRMTSLSYIILVYFVSNFVGFFPLNRNRIGTMQFIGRHAAQCGQYNFLKEHTTIAHGQTNYHVSQLVTEIKYQLTLSKKGSRIAFLIDMTSKLVICSCILPPTHAPSPCLRPELIRKW